MEQLRRGTFVKGYNVQKQLRIFFLMFIVGGCIILFIARIMSDSLDHMYRLAIDDQLKEKSSQYKILFEEKMESDLQMIYAITSFIELNDSNDMQQLAEKLYESNAKTSFLRMGYFNKDGNGVKVTADGSYECDITQDTICKEVKNAVQTAWTGHTAISEMYYESELKQNVFAYAIPVYNNTTITNVLFAVQDSAIYETILENIYSVSDKGMVAVIHTNGSLLMSTSSFDMSQITTIEDIPFLDKTSKQQLLTALTDHTTNSFVFSYRNIDYYACMKPLDVFSSYIVIIDTPEGVNSLLSKSMAITQISSIAILAIAVIFIIFSYRQIRKNMKHLSNIAYRDRLTGAYNKDKFNELLNQLWKENVSCGVAALNIRQFKFMNEIFGVTQSDQLLCYLKETIEKHLKSDEFFCRDTADSFFILYKEDSQEVVHTRLKKMFEEINQIAEHVHPGYPIYFYCGIAFAKDCIKSDDGDTELMTHVMFALNRAKQVQQTSIWFYDTELHKKEQLENYIESHMKTALENQEFQMYLQPKVDLKTKKVVSAEALVRWITDEKQTIFPDEFIPLFEENTFCIQLDLYMVEKACKQLREWIDAGYNPISISVNQTKLLFYEEGYVETLCEITEKYGIHPKYITLEILEGLAHKNVKQLNACIGRLRTFGFRISMDDFGSGFSSLNTLAKLQIDELKLDRNFLIKATEKQDSSQYVILESIIEMAKKLHIDTVAEGVETSLDEQMLRSLQCDFGQGYFYSRPLPAKEFTQKFVSNN